MEIIAETEQLPRGPYAGCIGWLGLDDDNVSLDTGITIRSMWVKDGKLHWQAGGGIVFDSDPVAEWNEVYNKSAIMRTVLNTTCSSITTTRSPTTSCRLSTRSGKIPWSSKTTIPGCSNWRRTRP